MRSRRSLSGVFAFVAFCASTAWAQSVISAHSGVVHYIEGDVTIDGTSIHPRFAEFPDLKAGQVLATEEGRVEVLLTPGVFLRLAENSSVRMISNSLVDTRMEVLSGTALVEAGELLANNAITFESHGVRIAIPKKGLYGIDADGARLKVYDGQALVSSGDASVTARKGHEIALDGGALADERFDVKDTDAFYRWNARRAEYIAEANVTAARVEANSSYRSGYTSGGGGSWSWNPWFGMFTFVPASGIYSSPFGAAFYSPGVISSVYIPQRSSYGGPSAFAGIPQLGGGSAGTASSSTASAPQTFGSTSGTHGGNVGGGFPGASGGHAGGPGRH
jgi:hypothetical protein